MKTFQDPNQDPNQGIGQLQDRDAWLNALLRSQAASAVALDPDEDGFVSATMQRLRQTHAQTQTQTSPRSVTPQDALALTARQLRQQALQKRALWLGALVGLPLASLLFWMLGGFLPAAPVLAPNGQSLQLLPWLGLVPSAVLAWLSLAQREA